MSQGTQFADHERPFYADTEHDSRPQDQSGNAGSGDAGHLSAGEILAAAKKPTRYATVAIPELGGKVVTIRSLTARERGRFEAQFHDKKTGGQRPDRVAEIRERLAVECCCNADGSAMFTREQLAELSGIDSRIVERIAKAVQDHVGMTDEDIGDLAGN